ncbi:5'-nucleotidase domain-containing protein 1-like [Tropilaelaps mercedesae]|uniref:5'-nucleotidase domain-containing protein 1 n=1 Tax=Tropilaelaps mercedesae TaxID=418985 RepID=A0A1V9XG62_9ACAR|nr:5'-nucleotidase domain-containing protein 1-like [Tropilaelaps mercedesae]
MLSLSTSRIVTSSLQCSASQRKILLSPFSGRRVRALYITRSAAAPLRTTSMLPMNADESTAPASGFSLSNYDVIGFDLDHTLARYRLPALYRLCYTSICKHLVGIGYPREIFRDFDESHLVFCQKGLVYDKERGNILKLGANFDVVRCFHGTKRLSDQEIREIYSSDEQINAMFKHMPFVREETAEEMSCRLHCFGDYFTVGTIYLLMEIIDAMDSGKVSSKDYAKPYKDFFEGYCMMYRREAFQEHTGYFFSEMRVNTEAMLHKCTPEILKWLKHLRSEGMKIVLITSSNADYAEMLLNYIIGTNWMDYFDSVVTWARKPIFWTQPNRVFYSVKDHREADVVGVLKKKTVYAQGSYRRLNELLKQLTSKQRPKMVYVGDSLVDDMYVPRKYDCCDTVGIVEEIEMEAAPGWKNEWGSFMYADEAAKSEPPSFWSSIISRSCKLVVPSIQELANHPRSYVYKQHDGTCRVFA